MRLFLKASLFCISFALAACAQGGRQGFTPPAGGALRAAHAGAVAPDALTYGKIYTFKGGFTGGSDPYQPFGPIAGGNGTYYLTTNGGKSCNTCGEVVLVDHTGGSYAAKTIYSFGSGADGSNPEAGVILDGGVIYGTTALGGPTSSSCGTIFSLAKSGATWKKTLIHAMTCTDGATPMWLTENPKTKVFYGVGEGGGTGTGCPGGGCGVVFELAPVKGKYAYSVLYNFQGGADGSDPYGKLALAPDGTLYGVTYTGGHLDPASCYTGCGTLFALVPSGKAFKHVTLYRFLDGADGAGPSGGLVFGATSATRTTLYGVTVGGGVQNCSSAGFTVGCGTVFSIPAVKAPVKKVNTLYTFQGPNLNDGQAPFAAVTATTTGLYGTTSQGGNEQKYVYGVEGTIWSLRYTGGYRLLHTFSSQLYNADGRAPDAAMMVDGGALVGTTPEGGGSKNCNFNGCGTIFAIKP